MSESNVYDNLSGINVDELLEWKGDLAYLNWARALKLLMEKYPDASHEIVRFPDDRGRDILPYLKTEVGYFVEVAVTVQGLRKSCLMPVWNEEHLPITKPTSADINSTIQRALTKAIAMHGLALYVYAGEAPLAMADHLIAGEPTAEQEPVYEIVDVTAHPGMNGVPYYMATFRDGDSIFEVGVFGDLIEVLDTLKVGDPCRLYTEEMHGKLAAIELHKAA